MNKGDLSIFQHGVDLLGAHTVTYQENIYDKMVWYVLNNCPEVEQYIEYVFLSTISTISLLVSTKPTNFMS